MFLEIIGAVIAVVAFSAIGYSFSQRFINRHRELLTFRMSLEILSSEIRYLKTPLPQAFEKIARRLDGPVSVFFAAAASKLDKGEGFPYKIWAETLDENMPRSALVKADFSLLKQLGVALEGDADCLGQLRQIKLVEKEVNSVILEAAAEKNKNVRLWRYLGLLGGMGVVILFF